MGSEVQQEERRGPSSSLSLSRSKLEMGSYLSPLVDLPRSPSPALLEIEVDPDRPVKLETSFGHHGIEVTFDSGSDSDSDSEREEEEQEASKSEEAEDNNVASPEGSSSALYSGSGVSHRQDGANSMATTTTTLTATPNHSAIATAPLRLLSSSSPSHTQTHTPPHTHTSYTHAHAHTHARTHSTLGLHLKPPSSSTSFVLADHAESSFICLASPGLQPQPQPQLPKGQREHTDTGTYRSLADAETYFVPLPLVLGAAPDSFASSSSNTLNHLRRQSAPHQMSPSPSPWSDTEPTRVRRTMSLGSLTRHRHALASDGDGELGLDGTSPHQTQRDASGQGQGQGQHRRRPPSGPSSPDMMSSGHSPDLLAHPHHQLLHEDASVFAFTPIASSFPFPRPPGRIVSYQIDPEPEPEPEPQSHSHSPPTQRRVPSAPLVPSRSQHIGADTSPSVRPDDSPIIPSHHLPSTSTTPRARFDPDPDTSPYSPPSPALTPSPDPSLVDSPILITPFDQPRHKVQAAIHHHRDGSSTHRIDSSFPLPLDGPHCSSNGQENHKFSKTSSLLPPIDIDTDAGTGTDTERRHSDGDSPLDPSPSLPLSSACHPRTIEPVYAAQPLPTFNHDHPSIASPFASSPSVSPSLSPPKQKQNHIATDASTGSSRPMHPMSGNWKENQATINLPPHPLHHKTPSVPFSAHTTSTFQVLGNGGSNGNGNINGRRITPSPSYVALQAGSKRLSKLTSSSGSSSIYSSDSSRHDRWHVTEKPDISTVFEEDSLDVDVDEPDQDQVIPKAHRPHNPLQSYPSVSTLTSRTTRTRQERSGTLSSSHSTRSTKSVHPFANAVVRPASPPLPQSRSDNFLSDHTRSATGELPVSRSSPNLENFRMPAQVAVISAAEKDDEETCPVCVESLSFTFRLPGEKPHIVPECGHALHEECFVTVYGDVPPEGSRKNLGVCGVCRQPMRIAEGERHRGKGGNKLAMLTGQSGGSGGSDPKLRHAPSSPSARSASSQDPSADDPLELHGGHSDPAKVCVPSITIRSEFPSIARSNRKGKQVMTAMVTVEVPPAGDRPKYPARARPEGRSGNISPQLPPSPRSLSPSGASRTPVTPDSFAHVVADLKHRVVDYKTSGLDSLGALRLFDLLCVRKGPLVREFHVYLFQEALICIAEEKKSGFRQIFSSGSSVRSQESNGTAGTGRGVLKLKGRIYVKHVRKVLDTSVQGELSLTITMEDESMDSFILTFKDKPSHETWKNNLQRLIEETKTTSGSASKIAKLMGAGAPINTKQPLSPSTVSSGASGYGQSYVATPSTGLGTMFSPASPLPQTPGDLAFAQPLALVHTPLDLVVVLSLPTPAQSQLPLKVKLMRQSLAFVLAALGPRDRISLVACEMGSSGTVRKTPFLCSTRYDSRKRLESFVETLGTGKVEDDEFEVTVGREERQDVVTAVNVALDVVLSRKAKNPLTGIILISDTADVIKRAQMELVTARLEAAHTPVHALGYGKTHDPSPLWMMSNHTHGTYTFVKEWYHLRDALAGVLGGLMSIALTNMKLHLSCQENDFKVTKVSGASQAIVSVTGKDVDVELRELRHGEVREILVELDLETTERYSNDGSDESGGSLRKSPNIHGLGLDTLSVSDASALRDVVYEEALIDEVPVTEVDCSFHDPAAGRSVARLAHPVLLTVAILPSNSPPSSSPADPTIVRRRMELLASDMVTRSLLIASRKNFGHATRILKETKRIIETIAEGLRATQSGVARSKREVQTAYAVEGLQAIVGDVDTLIDGLEEHKELFERDHRNYGAQQAIVLRAQKSWTTRTQTEKLYCTKEVQGVVQLSGEWSPRM